ncbi:hypothetical protein T261_7802 [Streptomyces lydicus]|nr:hypothetical protein T261_7802 [Streptomyces lydicus]
MGFGGCASAIAVPLIAAGGETVSSTPSSGAQHRPDRDRLFRAALAAAWHAQPDLSLHDFDQTCGAITRR